MYRATWKLEGLNCQLGGWVVVHGYLCMLSFMLCVCVCMWVWYVSDVCCMTICICMTLQIFPNLVANNYKLHVVVNGMVTFWLTSTNGCMLCWRLEVVVQPPRRNLWSHDFVYIAYLQFISLCNTKKTFRYYILWSLHKSWNKDSVKYLRWKLRMSLSDGPWEWESKTRSKKREKKIWTTLDVSQINPLHLLDI
jgi:hypothetical protein